MKHKGIYIAIIIFFLLVNTTYYWEGKMGMFAMVTFLVLIVFFIVLAAFVFANLFIALIEKFKNRQRLYLICILTIVLCLSFLYPGGLINFSRFEGDSLLIAQREGAANCMTTLALRDDSTFTETIVCFGVGETTGTYKVNGDTIFFENVSSGRDISSFYKFAVITSQETKSEGYLGSLVRYEDYSDTTGTTFWIIKNNLSK